MKSIVFFNLAVMPYHVAVFRALIGKGYQCVVYWWGKAPKTSYRAPAIDGLVQINRFNFVSWWIGLILFPIITVIAYIISITFIRGRIKLLFFPRNLNDLKLSFKTTRTQ